MIANSDRSANDNARSQTTPFDQRLQYRLADQALEMLTGWAILDAFEHNFANREASSEQVAQAHSTRREVAAVLANAKRFATIKETFVRSHVSNRHTHATSIAACFANWR